jgi:UDP-glucose 4-epimerase
VYGQDKVLDFTYVDDCVRGVAAGIDLLVSGREANQTINLAYGQGNSLVTLAEYISEELGVTTDITVRPSRVGEVTHYVANVGKARALLGYEPSVPLREGIRRAVAWSLANPAAD